VQRSAAAPWHVRQVPWECRAREVVAWAVVEDKTEHAGSDAGVLLAPGSTASCGMRLRCAWANPMLTAGRAFALRFREVIVSQPNIRVNEFISYFYPSKQTRHGMNLTGFPCYASWKGTQPAGIRSAGEIGLPPDPIFGRISEVGPVRLRADIRRHTKMHVIGPAQTLPSEIRPPFFSIWVGGNLGFTRHLCTTQHGTVVTAAAHGNGKKHVNSAGRG
jgi:hypothetical protein